MSLPKNFNKTVNTKKRFEALNDLNYYKVKFNVELTEGFEKKIRESEISGHVVDPGLDVIATIDKYNKVCFKKITALSDDEANRKMTEWLDSLKEESVLNGYTIDEIESNTFYEELDEKNLLPLVFEEEFNKVTEESKKGVN